MNNEWLSTLWEHYNILGSVAALGLIVAISMIGKRLLFKHPDLAEMRRINKAEDKIRWKKEKYPPMVASSRDVGKYLNLTFFLLLLPCCSATTCFSARVLPNGCHPEGAPKWPPTVSGVLPNSCHLEGAPKWSLTVSGVLPNSCHLGGASKWSSRP